MDSAECILCNKLLSEEPTVGVISGMKKLWDVSAINNDGLFPKSMTSVVIHVNCRKNYTRRIPAPNKEIRPFNFNRFMNAFDFKTMCLFCDDNCSEDKRHPGISRNIHKVETIEFKENILRQCDFRKDEMATKVAERVQSVSDLVAAECRYHGNCLRKFLKLESPASIGRPPISDAAFLNAFQKLCDYIDNNDEKCQYTIKELMDIFKAGLPDSEITQERTLIRKLELRYKENLKVESVVGKMTNLYFFVGKQTMHTKSQVEREKIIQWAAEILSTEIRSQNCNCDAFPTLSVDVDRNSNFPKLLNLFMTTLILNNKKTINHTRLERKIFIVQEIIMSLIRERSYVSPLLTNLGIHLHRVYDSKYLNNILSCLGLSCSYSEVLKFETSATLADEPKISLGAFTQMVFDNVDINVRTLDGRNTFHAMGGIICASPYDSISIQETLPRKFKLPAGHKFSTTPIQWYTTPGVNEVAPKFIMELIFCNCKKTTCQNLCSCRKFGLRCTPQCGNCCGMFCTNKVDENDFDEIDESDDE